MKRAVLAAVLAAALFALTSCAAEKPVKREFFAMDTYMTVTAYGDNAEKALEKAEKRVRALEVELSVTLPDSEIYKLNHGEPAALLKDTDELLRISDEIKTATGGAYNAMMYPVVAAWGFFNDEYRVPPDEEIASLLALTDAKIAYDNGNLYTTTDGAGIDFGGAAKGYASDAVAEALRNEGVTSAVISLGGNVYALGSKPDGSAWSVAVQDPFDIGGYAGILKLTDRAAVTSGAYQRFFELDGVIYHHIFDPETGKPADSGLASVTVVGEIGAECDALSTALFVMGKDRALEFWRAETYDIELVLIETGGEITVTSGLREIFTSDYAFEVAER